MAFNSTGGADGLALFILALVSIPASALWGILQGMTMIRCRDERFIDRLDYSSFGVRCHAWFRGYHWGFRAFLALAAATAIIGWGVVFDRPFAVAGLSFVWWMCAEAFYSWTRFAEWVPEQENVIGSGWYVWGANVALLQLARLCIGAALIARGIS